MHDLASRGSSALSMEVTLKVAAGQYWPSSPRMLHSCTHSTSSTTEDRKLTLLAKPSGKM